MGFIAQWFWYLLAFLVGSGIAWVITVVTIRPTSKEEANADLPAGSRELGVR